MRRNTVELKALARRRGYCRIKGRTCLSHYTQQSGGDGGDDVTDKGLEISETHY
jgi:hypothetical protein